MSDDGLRPRRSLAEWKAVARERLAVVPSAAGGGGGDAPLPAAAVADAAGQTEAECPTCDAAVATSVSNADLSLLLPIPGAAELRRATPASLRRAEREVTALLRDVQRDIALYMRHAGVAYDGSNLDALHAAGSPIAGAPFAERRTLRYAKIAEDTHRSAAAAAALEAARRVRAESYAAHHDAVQAYSAETLRDARAMERLRRDVAGRHAALAAIDAELQAELDAARQRLVAPGLRSAPPPAEDRSGNAAPQYGNVRQYALGM